MVRPKKVTILASDGKRYALMCKAKDELRKDGRLMDINRVCLDFFVSYMPTINFSCHEMKFLLFNF